MEHLRPGRRAKGDAGDGFEELARDGFARFYVNVRASGGVHTVAELTVTLNHRPTRQRWFARGVTEDDSIDVGEHARMLVKRPTHHHARQLAVFAIEKLFRLRQRVYATV